MLLCEKKELKRKELFQTNKEKFDIQSYYFALFSANIKKFLPEVNQTEYRKMFYEAMYYQHCSAMEQNDRSFLQGTKIINHNDFDVEVASNYKNTIVATFHLGSYRNTISYLYELGLKVVLIIDDSVFNTQLDAFKNTVKNVLRGKKGSDLIFLNVKDRSSIVKLKYLIQEGYVLAVYLDGNTGLKTEAQNFDKRYIPINFLDQTIFVKNGVGKLATLFGLKILPVLSYRKNDDENTMEFFKVMSINEFQNKEVYAQKSVERCYQLLESKLKLYPAQWECWGYIHNWFMRNKSPNYLNPVRSISKFNHDRYTIFHVNGSDFLFDLESYRSFPISSFVKEHLENSNIKGLDIDLRKEMVERNILV